MLALLWRQIRENTAARALWGYALFLSVFFFVSRFLNENYLGYLVALLTLGALTDVGRSETPILRQSAAQDVEEG